MPNSSLTVFVADVGCRSEVDHRALFLAVSEGNPWITEELLQKGVDANIRDRKGRTALINLCAQGKDSLRRHKFPAGEHPHYEQVVRLLQLYGLDIEARDDLLRTALHWAVAWGNEELAIILLDGCHPRGADVDALAKGKKTALHIAAGKSSTPIFELLLRHGADPTAPSQGAWRPLHNAAKEGQVEILKILLDCGVDAEAVTDNGRTALHWAAENGHIDCVRYLIPHCRLMRHAKDSKGKSPWVLAAKKHHNAVMHLLSPFNDDEHLSPLQKRVCQDFYALVTDVHPQKKGRDNKYVSTDVHPQKKGRDNKYVSTEKVSVYDLLYATNDRTSKPSVTIRAKQESIRKGGFRWIHLPANNVSSQPGTE